MTSLVLFRQTWTCQTLPYHLPPLFSCSRVRVERQEREMRIEEEGGWRDAGMVEDHVAGGVDRSSCFSGDKFAR
nr:hypothetical protein Iba_chr13aCG10060 [Ipomoea batatas]